MNCIESQLDKLARKRDYAADVLGKPMLALTYQMEIDKLAATPKVVTQIQIARLTKRSPSHIKRLISGDRGPGDFPKSIGGTNRERWIWSEVKEWFNEHVIGDL